MKKYRSFVLFIKVLTVIANDSNMYKMFFIRDIICTKDRDKLVKATLVLDYYHKFILYITINNRYIYIYTYPYII